MGKGKIVIITGANSGIGKAAAFLFAKGGHTVIMACRNLEKSRPVQQQILEESKNDKVELMELDMGSFASIWKFCSEFKERFERLDILIHNAAYFNHGSKYRLSPDNIELTFATNTFGPFFMTELLLEHLKKSEDARILHASSNIVKHFFDSKRKIDFDRLIGEMKDTRGFSVYDMYCQSKAALVMLTFKMAEEYKEQSIKVNALQINGAKMSKETLQKVTAGWRIIARIQNLFFPPAEKMADIYYNMCTSEEYQNITGKLINDKKEIMTRGVDNPSPLMQVKQLTRNSFYPKYVAQKENQEKIWSLCLEAVRTFR
ncbi:SDR family NAD(P)-dependent oxidoreductase [Robertmurraya andreesenii]|uniref:NAD(P)-dependent dehydrogenase (Short-subunit alcohol dehydrogenase family) n=1 Tax=Anoxybacillus andreesenii TaxID=1325932 RepID=A0ABT9V9G3_9BACL|nr:SDR family NAD(P)-dependent oxidoreductase [Robertmurraya andreesenii]MDQ0157591.1 NAD(P)-dependent dehydrogenase (short-subunit alcohol dehydrogenase family) [Robertmurraya andreesenii]